ncbi:MAG: DUF3971 domain-containing protein [Parvularculaceae bacterium]
MTRRAAKAGLILLEVLGVAAAVCAAATALLFWRLEQGPVSLDLFKPSAEFAVSRALGEGHRSEIEKLQLARGEARGEYVLTMIGLTAFARDGTQTVAAPRAAFVFGLADVFEGAPGPRRAVIENPAIRIVRSLDRQPDARNSEAREHEGGGSTRLQFGGAALRQVFRHALVTGAEVTFFDEASGRTWRAREARIEIERTEVGFSARAESAFETIGDAAYFNMDMQYTERSGVVSVLIAGEDAPLGDVLAMIYGEKARLLTAPVSGTASMEFTIGGDVLSSHFSARAEGGVLSAAGRSAPVEFIDVAAEFDPARNRFNIERLAFDIDGSHGEIYGAVGVGFSSEGATAPARVTFDLAARDMMVNAEGFFAEPLPIDFAEASGGYDIDARRLLVSSLSAQFLDVALNGAIEYFTAIPAENGDTPSPGVKASVKLDGALDPKRLLRIWPLGTAQGARDWVKARLERARLDDISFKVDLPPGAVLADGKLPDESMTLEFNLSNGVAHYIQGMTPLTGASGHGVLHGNSFKLEVSTANIGDVSLSEGEVDFPVFVPKWRPTYFRFTASGGADDILGVLNEEPLSLLEAVGFDPGQFSGAANARVEIMRPNKRSVPEEDYGYDGTATFENLAITEFYAGADLTEAAGKVMLETRRMIVTGVARLGGSPIELTWTENFYEEDGPSQFEAKGEVDSSTGDIFGVPTRQFLRGPVRFDALALGEIGAIEDLKIEADFADAALAIDALGWRKPPGFPAVGLLKLSADDSGVEIPSINLVGRGVNIDGALAFGPGGVIKNADFNRFILDGTADLDLSAERGAAGALNIILTGRYLNAGTLIETLISAPPRQTGDGDGFDWGGGLNLKTRIDRLDLRAGVELMDASLDFWRDSDRIQELEFSALNRARRPLSVSLGQTGEEQGPAQTIEARTDDIGALMGGLFGIESLKGGEGVMEIKLGDKSAKGLTGAIEARGLHVIRAPLLARIFAAGSLNGLVDILNGEGIALNTAFADFNFTDGVFRLYDARASGPSVGITAQGEIATAENGGVDLNGAVAPVYQVNSILGRIPGIGGLFVGRKGEGIVALSYQVSGDVEAPTVFVNPLSALTPGVLRRIFEPVRAAPDTAPPVEDAAPVSGGDDSGTDG